MSRLALIILLGVGWSAQILAQEPPQAPLAVKQAIVEGQVFNVVGDDLPSSRKFLRLYKRHVRPFRSVYVPKPVSYLFCWVWEKYSGWSQGQLPAVFTRTRSNSSRRAGSVS